jgi:hypothetical protein
LDGPAFAEAAIIKAVAAAEAARRDLETDI